jgi:hypothetical protein
MDLIDPKATFTFDALNGWKASKAVVTWRRSAVGNSDYFTFTTSSGFQL